MAEAKLKPARGSTCVAVNVSGPPGATNPDPPMTLTLPCPLKVPPSATDTPEDEAMLPSTARVPPKTVVAPV